MRDRLTIVRPSDLGDALARAVRDVCARPLALTRSDLPLLEARLACGDFESVLVLLREAPPARPLPFVLARYLTWTGDLQSAAAMWDTVLASLEQVLADHTDAALRRATCIELARTATDLGERRLAARLHGIARVDSAGGPAPAIAVPGSVPVRLTAPDSPPVAAQTQDIDPGPAMICDVAFNILGLEPDASRGRLRMRPRLDRFDELEAHHVRCGDASVRLTALRADGSVTIRVAQEAGSMPVTVLLEPFVTDPGQATVDGEPADLAPETVAGGTILPVQLVLDDVRTIVVRGRPA